MVLERLMFEADVTLQRPNTFPSLSKHLNVPRSCIHRGGTLRWMEKNILGNHKLKKCEGKRGAAVALWVTWVYLGWGWRAIANQQTLSWHGGLQTGELWLTGRSVFRLICNILLNTLENSLDLNQALQVQGLKVFPQQINPDLL